MSGSEIDLPQVHQHQNPIEETAFKSDKNTVVCSRFLRAPVADLLSAVLQPGALITLVVLAGSIVLFVSGWLAP